MIETILRSRSVIGLLALTCFAAGTSRASSTYGVISTGDVASGNGLSDFPTQMWNYSLGGNPEPVTTYISPVLSASGTYVFGNSTVSGSAMSWATIDNSNDDVNIHGYANATISGVCETCSSATENTGVFDVDWYDTLTIGGLPSGTPVSLMIVAALDSSISAPSAASYAYSQFELSSTEAQATNTGGASNGSISQSAIVQTTSGANLSLVAALYGIAQVNNLTQGESATVDASDTANFYIVVLTPGATYTSASGLSYQQAVPEPASSGVVGLALLALWAGMGIRYRSVLNLRMPRMRHH